MRESTEADNDPPIVPSEAVDAPQLAILQRTDSARLSAETTTEPDDADTATLADDQSTRDIAECTLDGAPGSATPDVDEEQKAKGRPKVGVDARDMDDGDMPAVKRSTTMATTVTPRYSLHSQRMRWFIVGLVSFAGLMS